MRKRSALPAKAVLLAIVGLAALAACAPKEDIERNAALLTHGDPARGRDLIRRYGCAGCHTVPGVPGANSLVGPPLEGISQRVYIAGVLPNTPDNLVKWIQSPREVDPKTAMPDMGVTIRDARDIAGYLYTLR
jgi:cytochrome c2